MTLKIVPYKVYTCTIASFYKYQVCPRMNKKQQPMLIEQLWKKSNCYESSANIFDSSALDSFLHQIFYKTSGAFLIDLFTLPSHNMKQLQPCMCTYALNLNSKEGDAPSTWVQFRIIILSVPRKNFLKKKK